MEAIRAAQCGCKRPWTAKLWGVVWDPNTGKFRLVVGAANTEKCNKCGHTPWAMTRIVSLDNVTFCPECGVKFNKEKLWEPEDTPEVCVAHVENMWRLTNEPAPVRTNEEAPADSPNVDFGEPDIPEPVEV